MVRGRSVTLCLLAALCASRVSSAQPRDDAEARAEAAFNRGVSLADRNQWNEAIVAFEEARAATALPAVLFNLAEAYRHVGRRREALAAYRDYLARVSGATPSRAAAEAQVAALRAEVAYLRVEVTPPEAQVGIDGERYTQGEVNAELDAGPHALAVRAEGYEPEVRTMNIAPGEHAALVVHLARVARVDERTPPLSPPPPSPTTTTPPPGAPAEPDGAYRNAVHLGVLFHIIPDVTGLGIGWGGRLGIRLLRALELSLGLSFNHTNAVNYVVGGVAVLYVARSDRFAFYMGPQIAAVIPDCREDCVVRSSGQRTDTSLAAAVSVGARLEVFRWFGLFVDANVGVMQWSDPEPFVYLGVGPMVSLGM